jgi:hypothetical protein
MDMMEIAVLRKHVAILQERLKLKDQVIENMRMELNLGLE